MTSRSLFIAAVFLVVSFMAFGLSYLVLNSTKLAITAFSGIVALVIFFIEPFVGLINYFLFLYVRPHEYVDALIGMPVMLMIGAATAALMLLHMIVNKRPGLYSRAPQNWLVVWFLLSIILSHLSFFYVEGAVESVRGFMPIVIMYLLIANGVTTEKKFKFTIQFIAVLTLILAISGIVQHFTGFGLGGAEMYRGRIQAIGIFEDPNDLALAIVMILPFFFFLLTQSRSMLTKTISAVAMVVLLFALYLTDSRGGMLSFGVISLLLFARKFGWVTGVVFGAVMIASMFVLSERMSEISTGEASAAGRIEAWVEGLSMFQSRPLFGIGEGHFTEYHFRTAHNSYVLCAAELGLVGLFPWIFLIYLSVKNTAFIARDLADQGRDGLALYVDAVRYALIAYIAAGYFLSRTYSELLFILVGLAAAVTHIYVKSTPCKFVLVERRDFAIVLVIMVGVFVFTKSFVFWAW